MKTYKEQFDVLTSAYINEEVDPFSCHACFCGNLLQRSDKWSESNANLRGLGIINGRYLKMSIKFIESNGYTRSEIFDLESVFLWTYQEQLGVGLREMMYFRNKII